MVVGSKRPDTEKGSNPEILVAGGAGYIGSHTCVALIESGYTPVIVDNFSNSHPLVLSRIEAITGHRPQCYTADIADCDKLDDILAAHDFQAVIHFAGVKAVGRSVSDPLSTYRENVCGSISLLEVLQRARVKRLIFSSSATVYGDAETVPISETSKIQPTNPYGQSKAMIEQVLNDLAASDPLWSLGVLRYFNPVGAHKSGEIGEDPQGIPDNLFPYVAQVAVGRRDRLQVFGDDYDTPDGTGVRDYIHVVDLAIGRVQALEHCLSASGVFTVNLGTGNGNSVLEMIHAFEKTSGKPVPYEIVDRRPGDVATSYANPAKAHDLLGFEAERDLGDMCRDAWNWQQRNPMGFKNG
ncbi:MAG: UDP-glucose 4-epimerase GalE [Rhizobiales bacterium]|nr:UDP-glucose 4-epimerase GalE [Hyphomicrobiales bacterium]